MRDYRQVQQIIAGLAEGVILIDLNQRILWANDAALAMHGVTRLNDLGTTMEEYRQRFRLRYRNNHPLDRGEHPIERVIAGEESSDVTVEVSHVDDPERCWIHAIRCFVITDDQDKPDYLVLIIEDETDRFEAEERFESAFNANPAPAIICRLSDLRYVKVNPGFLEMTGYAREDVIGRSAYEIDVLAEAEMRDLALERLKEGQTIPQMEACLALPGGVRKLVIVAGQPIEIQDASCMLFTFADLDPRRKAEMALRQSEERFAKSFRLSPVPATICMLDGLKVIEANEAYTKITGYAEEEIVGRSSAELGVWPDRATRERFKQAIDKEGSVRNFDIQLRTKDGTAVDCCSLGRGGHDQRSAMRAVRHAGHHRAQTVGKRADRRNRGCHGGHVLVQPQHRGEARRTAPNLSFGFAQRRPERLDRARAGYSWPDLRGAERPRDERDAEAVAEHDPKPCLVALPEDRRQSTQRRDYLGEGARDHRPGRSQVKEERKKVEKYYPGWYFLHLSGLLDPSSPQHSSHGCVGIPDGRMRGRVPMTDNGSAQ